MCRIPSVVHSSVARSYEVLPGEKEIVGCTKAHWPWRLAHTGSRGRSTPVQGDGVGEVQLLHPLLNDSSVFPHSILPNFEIKPTSRVESSLNPEGYGSSNLWSSFRNLLVKSGLGRFEKGRLPLTWVRLDFAFCAYTLLLIKSCQFFLKLLKTCSAHWLL